MQSLVVKYCCFHFQAAGTYRLLCTDVKGQHSLVFFFFQF